MTLLKLVFCAILLLAVPAFAAEDASRFVLTADLMQKLKSAETDMKALHKADEAVEAAEPEPTIDSAIAKLEKDPETRTILAKHGLSTRDLVLASFAMLHAGMYVSMEQTMDKKKSKDLFKGYTKEQKANIALVRAMVTQKKK